MKIMESWRFAIKSMKLSYNLKSNLSIMGFLGVLGLVYEIFNITDGMGAYMLLVVAIYPAQLINSICGSQLVQSSPCKKTLMTSLSTVITFCCGVVMYLTIVCIEMVRVYITPEAAGHSARLILICGLMQMLLHIYIGIAYKYFVLPMVLMCVCMVGFYNLSGIIGNGTVLSQYFLKIPMPMAIAIGLCLALLGALLQYAVSLLVYKKPISRRAIYGMLRQQA